MSFLSEISKTVVNAQLAFAGATAVTEGALSPLLAQPYVQTGSPVLIPDMQTGQYGLGAFDENATTFAYPVPLADGSVVFHVFTNAAAVGAPPQFTLAATVPVAGASTSNYMYSTLSRNGLVYAIGAQFDNGNIGAAFVFTRPSSVSQVWTQVATRRGVVVDDFYGSAISMSADGSVIAVGATGLNGQVGQTDVYNFNYATGGLTLAASLVGSGAVGQSEQGYIAVALSGDGQTLAVGGYGDDAGVGAVWMFANDGTTWSQTGSKLVPLVPSPTPPGIGGTVSLSFDGQTLAFTTSGAGNMFLYTLDSNGVWIQSQTIFPLGAPPFGSIYWTSVSDDGNVVMFDYFGAGGVMVYNRQPDGLWVQNGTRRVPTGDLIDLVNPGLYLAAVSPTGSLFACAPFNAPPLPGNPIVFTIFQ